MGKINTDNYPNRPFASYQDDDMFILQDNGGETYTTNVGDIKNLADSRIKLEGVQVNGTDLPISGKKVNVDISGKTDLKVIAFPFHDPEPGEPSMGFYKGAYVTYNGKLYEFTQEHQGAWNPSHVREIDVDEMYVRAGNGGYDTGRYSTTEGHSTRAEGEASHAEGLETIANSDNQHVEGKYNVADTDDEYALIVGNGTADNARSNAMTLDWDGNLVVSGDIADGNGDVMVEGNPVTFGSPFEQDAKSVVVSVKPIQAGSGTPSPYNIRPISGIDEVEIEVSDGEGEPTTTTIPLPSTLYDADVDVTNGEAEGTKDKIVLDGSDDEGWRQSTSPELPPDRRVFYPFDFPNSKPAGDDGNTNLVSMSSNMYDIGTTSYYGIVQMTSFAIGIGGTASGATIGVNVDGSVIDTLADFKAWLAQNPLEICYELATPTTLSFDPTDVELLEGTNVVSTNGEKVAVTYGRSLWQDINDLKTDTEGKLDKSDVANVEGDTASRPYAVNEFMLRSDGFYKVTQPIASGASITASNTTKTTIGAVLTALLNA